jgi:hypothetical protein
LHLHRLLGELRNAAAGIHAVAQATAQHPGAGAAGQQAVQSLVQNLHYTEKHLATVIGRALRRPLPTPDTDAVGAWADQMERLNLPDPNLPEELAALVRKLQGQVQEVANWLRQVPNPAAGPTGAPPNAGPAASPAGVPQPTTGQKALGWGLYAIATLGGLASVWATYRADKTKARNFGVHPDDLTPQDAEKHAQQIIDHELPGASVKVTRTPDGSWVSSVKKGTETLARTTSHDPARAATQAVEEAVNLEAARRETLDRAQVIGPAK